VRFGIRKNGRNQPADSNPTLYNVCDVDPNILWKNFELPNQLVTAQEKIVIQKAPTSIKIEATTKKDNLQKIRDYLETK